MGVGVQTQANMWRTFAEVLNTPFFNLEISMKTTQTFTFSAVAAVVLLGLVGGCAGMSTQDKATAVGAAAGAVGGAVLTDGSAAGTLGGAAVGGVIGHEVSKDKDKKD